MLLTAAAGFYLGARDRVDLLLLANTLIGTALVAGGTNAWNQIRERDVDARMARTRRRPLPSGRLTTRAAIWFATAITAGGIVSLGLTVNLITAVLAALTFASYVLLYTPLKRKTSLNTLIGAVPGALPIVGGWTAAGGSLGSAVRVDGAAAGARPLRSALLDEPAVVRALSGSALPWKTAPSPRIGSRLSGWWMT